MNDPRLWNRVIGGMAVILVALAAAFAYAGEPFLAGVYSALVVAAIGFLVLEKLA